MKVHPGICMKINGHGQSVMHNCETVMRFSTPEILPSLSRWQCPGWVYLHGNWHFIASKVLALRPRPANTVELGPNQALPPARGWTSTPEMVHTRAL